MQAKFASAAERTGAAGTSGAPELVDFESFLDDYLTDLHQSGGRNGRPGTGFASTTGRSSQQQSNGHGSETHRSNDGMPGSSGDSGPNSPVQGTGRRGGAAAQKALSAKSAASKRTLELQEKNRRAQRRFRERQKNKVAELEGKVEELSGVISQLTGDKASLESRVSILVRVLQMRDDQIEQMRRKITSDGEIAASLEDLKLTVSEGQEMTLSPEQVKNLSRDGIVRIWKNYVQQLAGLLVENEKNPGNAKVLKTIETLAEEVSMLCMRLHLSNPKATREFVAQKLEETHTEQPEVEIAGRWLQLARSLGLSPEQRREICQLRRLFFQKMSLIAEQRQEIHAQLMAAMPAPSFSRTTALQSLRAHDSIDQLRFNLREEHILKMDWVLTLFKHTLGPLQVARTLVQAWPWSPDTLSMATFVAAEEGDQEALAALSAATRGLLLNPSVPIPFEAMPAAKIIDAAAQVVPHLLTSKPDFAPLPTADLDFSLQPDEAAAASRFMSLPVQPHSSMADMSGGAEGGQRGSMDGGGQAGMQASTAPSLADMRPRSVSFPARYQQAPANRPIAGGPEQVNPSYHGAGPGMPQIPQSEPLSMKWDA